MRHQLDTTERGPGRPPRKGSRMRDRLELRCTSEEREAVRVRAALLGLSVADYLRSRIPELRE